MRLLAILILVTACGRVSFQPVDRIGAADGGGDPDGMVAGDVSEAMLMSGLRLWMQFEPGAELLETVSQAPAMCPACGSPTTGPRGGARAFSSAAQDCMTLWDAPDFETPEFTLALWINFSGANTTSVFGKARDSATSPWNSWELWFRTNNLQLEFQTTANNTYNEDVIVPMQTNVWIHIAATYTATSKAVFFDGVEVGREDPADPLAYGSDPVRIGCDVDNGTEAQYLDGAIDDVRYYDRVLTLAEIQALAAP